MSHTSRQQVVRVDREPEPLAELHPVLLNLVNAAREYATASRCVPAVRLRLRRGHARLLIFSRCARCLENKPVILDSRYRMLDFEGVTAATPNEPEVEAALGIEDRHRRRQTFCRGRAMLKQMRLESLVITRGRDGMVAFEKDTAPLAISIFGTDQVVDVTGAGDTVIATFVAALAAGADTADRRAAGQLRRRHRGDEARHRHRVGQELLAAIDQYSATTSA